MSRKVATYSFDIPLIESSLVTVIYGFVGYGIFFPCTPLVWGRTKRIPRRVTKHGKQMKVKSFNLTEESYNNKNKPFLQAERDSYFESKNNFDYFLIALFIFRVLLRQKQDDCGEIEFLHFNAVFFPCCFHPGWVDDFLGYISFIRILHGSLCFNWDFILIIL